EITDTSLLDKDYLSTYYIKNGNNEYELATEFNTEDYVYYYKSNYKLIEENCDITNSYFEYTINLVTEKDVNDNITSCKLTANNITSLDYNVNLTLKLTVIIEVDDESFYYNGFTYGYAFIGYKS
ncbi:MAG TPA: hypothetical protein DCO89_00485, partial [Clostridiales bacterium]|nr:hypothetical protein [Clostridiales bacterium]